MVTPNLDHIVMLEKDSEFAEIYSNADLILVDRKTLIWNSKLLKTPINEKISGSDFFHKCVKCVQIKGIVSLFLVLRRGIAAKTAKNLCQKYKGPKVVGTYSSPLGFEKTRMN